HLILSVLCLASSVATMAGVTRVRLWALAFVALLGLQVALATRSLLGTSGGGGGG
ncbi:unnamed protein product, partial [Musa hybrid cultivar]